MTDRCARIQGNLAKVREEIEAARQRAGRTDSVRLVAVTKTVGLDEIKALYDAGVRDFGENRVDVALEKIETFPAQDVRWHLIGHLQRNKAKSALAGGFALYHGVESLKLIGEMDKICRKNATFCDVLLEVNIAGEENKYGLASAMVESAAQAVLSTGTLRLCGLMTMAPYTQDETVLRKTFSGLREVRNSLETSLERSLPELSMGMSNDYSLAVEEGATMVRVGSALFE